MGEKSSIMDGEIIVDHCKREIILIVLELKHILF